MKKYKFIIKKVKEKEIEVYAENHSEAMFEMLQKAVETDEEFFSDDLKNRRDLYMKIEKIIDENGKEDLKDYEDFIKENNFFITKIDSKNFAENKEEIEDDMLKEDEEICGKCLLIDYIIHRLDS